MHWQSDVTQGRAVAAMVVAKLHGDAQFRADLNNARAEIRELLAGPAIAVPGCSDATGAAPQ